MKSSKVFPWIALAVLILMALACSLTESETPIPLEEIAIDIPGQEAGAPETSAATWTPIPTFTAVALAIPTATQGEVDHPPTATEEQAPPEPTQAGPRVEINPLDGASMVYIPAGDFIMGSDAPSANPDERPAHTVTLDAFWLYQTEVTNAQYHCCITEGACEGSLSRYPEDNLPAVNVNWFDAQAYCQWAGGDLPTEAQWEKGARGTDERPFPWGDVFPTCDLANFINCYQSKEIAVGSLPGGASPYGALDMAGNVWEWVRDWYDPEFYGVSPNSNPTGPVEVEEEFRVQRGGSFENDPDMLYVSIRSRSGPEKSDYRKGFRCVMSE